MSSNSLPAWLVEARQLLNLQWLRYGKLWCHLVSFQSLVQSLAIDAKTLFRFAQVEYFAEHREFKCVSFVVVLIYLERPLAIVWRVVTIIFDSVQGVFLAWPTPHVFRKTLESTLRAVAIQPPIAHFYSSPTIARIATPFRAVAAALHVAPYPLLCLVGKAMQRIHQLRGVWHRGLSDTSAVCGLPIFQVSRIDKPRSSTLAYARRLFANFFTCGGPFSVSGHASFNPVVWDKRIVP